MSVSRAACQLSAIALILGGHGAPAIAAFDAGAQLQRLQRESRAAEPRKENPAAALPEGPSRDAAAASNSAVFVSAFEIHGVTRFDNATIESTLSGFTGKTLDTAAIHKAADTLMRLYRDAGYFAAMVYIPPQDIDNGVLRFDVYEGALEKDGIEIENRGQNVRSEVVGDILAYHLAGRYPIHRDEYERALLIAEDLPGIHTSSLLYPGQRVGGARLRTRVEDSPRWAGNADIDNFGNEHTGRWRLGTTLYWNSPTGIGDQAVARLVTAGSGSNYAYLTYLRPLSPSGTRVGVSADVLSYRINSIADVGDADGKASDLQLYLTHPIIRSRHGNLHFRGQLSHLTLDDTNDLDVDSHRTVNSLTLSIDGDEDHDWLPNGLTLYRAAATFGHTDVRGNTAFRIADQAGSDIEGNFAHLNLLVSRLQHIAGPWSLFAQLRGQIASGNLDSSQQFYLGGPTSLAAYPVGEVGGDEGAELHAEIRYAVASPPWGGQLQMSLFYETGYVRVHDAPWTGWQGNNAGLANEFSLRSAGVSATQNLGQDWLIHALIGWQFGANPAVDPATGKASDESDANHRAWLQVVRYF